MIILNISATRKDIHWITKGIKKNPKYSHRQIKLQRKDKDRKSMIKFIFTFMLK